MDGRLQARVSAMARELAREERERLGAAGTMVDLEELACEIDGQADQPPHQGNRDILAPNSQPVRPATPSRLPQRLTATQAVLDPVASQPNRIEPIPGYQLNLQSAECAPRGADPAGELAVDGRVGI